MPTARRPSWPASDLAYARAVIPRTFHVLGVRLQPFTLGHALLLQRLGSPFGSVGRVSPGRGDLALALFVCSRPWRQAEAQIGRWWVTWWMRISTAIGVRWKRGLIEFAEYWRFYNSDPQIDLWKPPSQPGPQPQGPPILQTLKLFSMMECAKSHDAALDTPLNEALWDYICFGLQKGWLRLRREGESEIIAEVKRLKLEAAARARTN